MSSISFNHAEKYPPTKTGRPDHSSVVNEAETYVKSLGFERVLTFQYKLRSNSHNGCLANISHSFSWNGNTYRMEARTVKGKTVSNPEQKRRGFEPATVALDRNSDENVLLMYDGGKASRLAVYKHKNSASSSSSSSSPSSSNSSQLSGNEPSITFSSGLPDTPPFGSLPDTIKVSIYIRETLLCTTKQCSSLQHGSISFNSRVFSVFECRCTFMSPQIQFCDWYDFDLSSICKFKQNHFPNNPRNIPVHDTATNKRKQSPMQKVKKEKIIQEETKMEEEVKIVSEQIPPREEQNKDDTLTTESESESQSDSDTDSEHTDTIKQSDDDEDKDDDTANDATDTDGNDDELSEHTGEIGTMRVVTTPPKPSSPTNQRELSKKMKKMHLANKRRKRNEIHHLEPVSWPFQLFTSASAMTPMTPTKTDSDESENDDIDYEPTVAFYTAPDMTPTATETPAPAATTITVPEVPFPPLPDGFAEEPVTQIGFMPSNVKPRIV